MDTNIHTGDHVTDYDWTDDPEGEKGTVVDIIVDDEAPFWTRYQIAWEDGTLSLETPRSIEQLEITCVHE